MASRKYRLLVVALVAVGLIMYLRYSEGFFTSTTHTLQLNLAQPPTGRPTGTTAAEAAKAGTVSQRSIPPAITGFQGSKATFSFKLPDGSTAQKIEAVVEGGGTVAIPINPDSRHPPTNIKAIVSGNSVTLQNVSSGQCCLNILGGRSGNFTLNVTTP